MELNDESIKNQSFIGTSSSKERMQLDDESMNNKNYQELVHHEKVRMEERRVNK